MIAVRSQPYVSVPLLLRNRHIHASLVGAFHDSYFFAEMGFELLLA